MARDRPSPYGESGGLLPAPYQDREEEIETGKSLLRGEIETRRSLLPGKRHRSGSHETIFTTTEL